MAASRKPARQNTADHVGRGARGRWLPGQSPNPGGRPRAVADVRELARQRTATAIATLVEIAESGKAEAARVSAAAALLDRGWGRPTQPLAGDDDMPPIGIEDGAAREARARAILDSAFGANASDDGVVQ